MARGSCMKAGKGQFWRAPMAVRRIRQLGDPILRVRCDPVHDPKSPAVRLLADDLRATLRYTDIKGKSVTMDLEGTMAELLQHELDHLDGILALDQPAGLDPFAYKAEWEKLHKPAERYGPPRPREV